MFKNDRPTPTAATGIRSSNSDPDYIKCRWCGFWANTTRDIRCPFCDSDNYIGG